MLERQEADGAGLAINPEVFSEHFPNGIIEAIPHEVLPLKLQRSVHHPLGSVAFTINSFRRK